MLFVRNSQAELRAGQHPWAVCIVASLLAVGCLCIVVRFREWAFDDAFIVFRYAQNILLGRGWVFNPDEVYNASTSVLNTLLITFLAAVTGKPLLSSVILGTLSLYVIALCIFYFLRKETNVWLAGFFALCAIWLIARWHILGVETLPFIALIMVFLLLEDTKTEAGWVLGLVFLARPDGLLLSALKWGKEFYTRRKLPIRSLVCFAAITTPWVVFSYVQFEQLLPSTLGEKMWQGRSGYWGEGNVYLRGLRHSATQVLGWGEWGAMLAPFAVWGLYDICRRRSVLLYFLLFALGQQLFYVILNVPAYHWYFAPLHTILLIGIFIGFIRSFEWLRNRFSRVQLYEDPISLALLSLCLIAMLANHTRYLEHPEPNRRLEAYSQIARFVRERFPDSKLAALEVGTFAFLTDSPVVDITGLTSPEPEFISPKNMDRFYELAPDVLILHRGSHGMESSIQKDPRFRQFYARLRDQPRRGYILFGRKERRRDDAMDRTRGAVGTVTLSGRPGGST